ncbi:hypothetical protein [Oceanirhabdus seepicola]|uniref:DUF5673 domain-containing protein n=1 Tax=Oceanirhabdus seepicola TaxID=2828781 RepID=A0A9J6NXE4_9CLOT|nr:hypothetical protein [Oceanirhabdus seepicola]MCM1988931.1 hypothetical protein [Oceanirhabdus seepicola]
MKNKIISIVGMLIFTIVTIGGGMFLATKGFFYWEFIGLSAYTWLKLICGISIVAIILYDYINIRIQKKKDGELKFILKRKNKKNQVVCFIAVLISFFIQTVILTKGFKEFNSDIIFLFYFHVPLLLVLGYRHNEKEGLGEEGIYYWGSLIAWKNAVRYSFNENTLILVINKKTFGINEIVNIPFIIEDTDKTHIEKFLCDRVEEACCDAAVLSCDV